MTAPALISADHLIDSLGTLCTQPSSVGRDHELAQTAEVVRRLMVRCGLQTSLVPTDGAPVVVGVAAGTHPLTLLLYHHYDTAAVGSWHTWHHDPHVLAERDGALYARGVAEGKGPLAAHLSALAALRGSDDRLTCNVVVVAEGEGLSGSPHLSDAIHARPELFDADSCLASIGFRDGAGTPFCFSGSKGQMRVRLSVRSADQPLSSGLAATVPNALWRLLWAIAAIKGEDEDIAIPGFYDQVEGPSRELNRAMRGMTTDEAARLQAWALPQFLFGMTNSALIRADVTLPTCNVSTITAEPVLGAVGIPPAASALLDFQLVPQQQPAAISDLLQEHLLSKGFSDVACERLPGGYPAATTTASDRFIDTLCRVGSAVYESPLPLLPLGAFAAPLAVLQRGRAIPVASVGMQRPDQRSQADNEHVRLVDLQHHGQLLLELLWAYGQPSSSI